MIGLCMFDGADVADAGFIPCLIDRENNPVPLEQGTRDGRRVTAYMRRITQQARLPTRYSALGPNIGRFRTVLAAKECD